MNRRAYLGLTAAVGVGALAGCTDATDGREYPPYPDGESTDFSGDGPGTTDAFEISLNGPTFVDLRHHGEDNFTVILDTPTDDNSTNETAEDDDDGLGLGGLEPGDQIDPVATIAAAAGPYDGRTLHRVESGRYVLRVLEADDSWEATVYDLPVYEDGVGIELPLERDGAQYDVIGPLNFGDEAATTFEFSVTGQGFHRVFLTDRTGEESLSVTDLQGDGEDSVSQDISGVGYVEVLSVGSWDLTVEQ